MSVEASERRYQEGLDALTHLPEVRELAGRSVCIAGCTGLIGGALTMVLIRANQTVLRDRPVQITGIARTADAELPADAPGFHFVASSVASPELPGRLAACDYVLYVAGKSSDYLADPAAVVATQIVGLEQMLASGQGTAGFVFISSTRVYGRENRAQPIVEESVASVPPMALDNIYDAPKRFGESLCLWQAQFRNRRTMTARLANIYGAASSLRSKTALTDFVRQAVEKRAIALTGHPDTTRNYVCILDVAQGLLKMLAAGRTGEAYNIGSHEHLSTRQIAEQIGAVLPYAVEVTWPLTGVQPAQQPISIEKARTELGFEPQFTFAQLAPLVVQRTAEQLDLAF